MSSNNSSSPTMIDVPIKTQEQLFSKHLELTGNDRIFFSGKFGSGKTHFLKEFFKSRDKEYNVIHIYPVNYSIASNEDIMELIKADIIIKLFELPEERFQLHSNQVSLETALFSSFRKHPEQLFFILDTIPGGSHIKQFLTGLLNINKKAKEELKQLSEDHRETLMNHLQSLGDSKGNIFEENAITKILQHCIEQLSKAPEKNKQKESVLILDDLDRIDPDHIFRILNVFAAHLDNPFDTTAKNKFGFDKIILVGDAENIRHIFHHRFGTKTDSSGYLDKFYSKTVFEYSLKNVLFDYINEYLKRAEITPLIANNRSQYRMRAFLGWIMEALIDQNLLTIRGLKQFNGQKIDIVALQKQVVGTDLRHIDFAFDLYCFCMLMGSYEDAITKVQALTSLQNPNHDYILPNILLLSNIGEREKLRERETFTVQRLSDNGSGDVTLYIDYGSDYEYYGAKFADKSVTKVENIAEELVRAIRAIQ